MSEQKRYVVGVDCGGSKTHTLIVALDGAVIAEAFSGPSNLQRIGVEKTVHAIMESILEACKKGQCTVEELQSVVIGAAGAGRPADKSALVNHLLLYSTKKKFPLKNISVESDARIALEAAFAGGPGIIVIGGTGSIALYRTEEHKFLRAGGWGLILGDEGGGYAIGRDALNAVMRQHDGRSEKTILTRLAQQHFGVAAVEALIPKIYQEHADVASFAPSVLTAVTERDRVAHLILVKNSNELAELVRVLTMQARPRKKLPVSLMGGLLSEENVYSKMVKDKINNSLPNVVVQKPKFSAAFGAAIIALNAFR